MSAELTPAAREIAAGMGRSIARGLDVMAASLVTLADRAEASSRSRREAVRQPARPHQFMNVVDQDGKAIPSVRNADGSWTTVVPDGVTGISGCLISVTPWTAEDSLAEARWVADLMGPPRC